MSCSLIKGTIGTSGGYYEPIRPFCRGTRRALGLQTGRRPACGSRSRSRWDKPKLFPGGLQVSGVPQALDCSRPLRAEQTFLFGLRTLFSRERGEKRRTRGLFILFKCVPFSGRLKGGAQRGVYCLYLKGDPSDHKRHWDLVGLGGDYWSGCYELNCVFVILFHLLGRETGTEVIPAFIIICPVNCSFSTRFNYI